MVDFQNYTYLITGGAGFIGSHLVEYLSRLNCKVIVVDNLSTGSIDNIKGFENVEFFQIDINDTKSLSKIMSSVDYIFHFAALGSVNRSIDNPLSTHLSNSTGFLSVLQTAVENKIKGIIYSSSSSVYGDDKHLPKTENRIGMPLSPYAVTKVTNELYAKLFWNLYKIPVVGLRYFNVFGPRQNPNGPYAAVIPLFIQKMLRNEIVEIHGTGEQKRDFTYVANVVYANILALQAIVSNNTSVFGEVMNVGCHQSISVNELFNILSRKLNYSRRPVYIQPRKGDIFESLADIGKIARLLNYSPQVLFDEGIDKTIDYYKSSMKHAPVI